MYPTYKVWKFTIMVIVIVSKNGSELFETINLLLFFTSRNENLLSSLNMQGVSL